MIFYPPVVLWSPEAGTITGYLRPMMKLGLTLTSGLFLACAPIMDGEWVGRRIQREFIQRTKLGVSVVECPQDQESRPGQQFTCTLYDRDQRQLSVQVTLGNDPADFTWSVPSGLVNLAVIEGTIEQTFKTERLTRVTAFCGESKGKRFKIAGAGDRFPCQVQEVNASAETVEVKVREGGKVDFQVVSHKAIDLN